MYENDKCRAKSIQQTVRSDVADMVPAGGHQGYASLGALYSQARPMLTNLYGDIPMQTEGAPVSLTKTSFVRFIFNFVTFIIHLEIKIYIFILQKPNKSDFKNFKNLNLRMQKQFILLLELIYLVAKKECSKVMAVIVISK